MVYVALLRGINVGGKRLVPMADLRALLLGLGFVRPRTLLQSGNVVFEAGATPASELERMLEAETERRFGMRVDVFVRTRDVLANAVAGNPYPNEAKRDPAHLVLMFLKSAPRAEDIRLLQAALDGPEYAAVVGAYAYICYPAGIGNSCVTNAFVERRLQTTGTARNWNTLVKLRALAEI